MVFSLGNLLVIGIVLVILAIFRQWDRNSKTLDKVRRYADKAREELDKVVLERVQNLKDLSIELDIQQKAGKEILKRIQGIEEGIQEKLSSVDTISSRLKEYDKVLVDLIEMTKRAEENIHRLKEESIFVDETAKRIKTLQSKVEAQEARIPEIINQFETLNTKKLENLTDRILKNTEKSVEELEGRIADGMGKTDELVLFLQSSESRFRQEASSTEGQLRKLSDDLIAEVSQRLSDIERSYLERLEEAAKKGESLETKALQKLKEHVEEKMRATFREFLIHLEGEKAALKNHADELEQKIYALERRMEDSLREVEERGVNSIQALEQELQESVRVRTGEIKEYFSETKSAFTEELSQFTADATGKLSTLREKVQTLDDEVSQHVRVWEEKMGLTRKTIDQFTEETKGRIETLTLEFHRELREVGEQFSSDLASLRQEMERGGQDLNRSKQELSAQLDTLRNTFQGDLKGLEQFVKKTFQEEEEKILRQSEEFQLRTAQKWEARLQEQEREFGYRFAKIEEVSAEIDNLENNLRTFMERSKARLQEDFANFGKQLHAQRLKDQEDWADAMEKMRASMAELEKGLAELKNQAYQNVSEKLKLFEDEFFQDLRTKDQQMQSKFMEWQNQVDGTLDSLMRTEIEERRKIEQRYTSELSSVLQDFQQRFLIQTGTLNSELEGFRKQTEYRLREFEKTLDEYQDQMRKELEEQKAVSYEAFSAEFTRHQKVLKEEMERFSKEYEARLKSLLDAYEIQKKDLAGKWDTIRSDVTLWQAKVAQDIKSSEADITNQLSGFKLQVSTLLGSLRDEFLKQKNDFLMATEEERKRLKEELVSLAGKVDALSDSLRVKTEEALQSFRRGYEEFSEEFQRKFKDLQAEADGKVRDIRSYMKDAQERFEALYQKLFGNLEENAKVLALNVAEIEKKQKAFIEQTKIFDRADALRQSLSEQIEDMKRDLQRIEDNRKELKETEAQFLRLKKLGEEASERLTRFTAEKRRIDSLEEDFKKLMAMSEGIEVKLRQVATSEDGIQSIQANLRSLQSLHQEVESRFERLEKKRKLLDITLEGIDKNFQSLQDMEKRLDSLEKEAKEFPEVLENLTAQIQSLLASKGKVEDTIQKMSNLDSLLKDLETRSSNLLKAREWLAKTETRLQELNRAAEDQVKLLGSLLKEGGKGPNRGERGAPSLSARETVTKLAHQGWTVEQIATATKLSRGEVELILELSGKS